MILRTSLTSPFGRKVRMAAELLELTHHLRIENASTLDENDTIRQQNPLGKIPVLILEDGRAVFDSRTIVEFLCSLAPRQTLLPSDPADLAHERTRGVLADGITDAALLMVYEGRFRTEAQRSERWLAHQNGKVERALTALSRDLPPLVPVLVSTIALACALDYLDWRKPVDWRSGHPDLVAWLEAFDARHPALKAIRA